MHRRNNFGETLKGPGRCCSGLFCLGIRLDFHQLSSGDEMSKVVAGVIGFDEALEMVVANAANLQAPATELVPLLASEDRVLATGVHADRDQPPFDRSTRDGFAVKAADFGDRPLKVAGQIRAGDQWQGAPL